MTEDAHHDAYHQFLDSFPGASAETQRLQEKLAELTRGAAVVTGFDARQAREREMEQNFMQTQALHRQAMDAQKQYLTGDTNERLDQIEDRLAAIEAKLDRLLGDQ